MSNATICCLRISRFLRRNTCASAGEAFDDISALALWRERFVRWTIWCARSSKTVDYTPKKIMVSSKLAKGVERLVSYVD